MPDLGYARLECALSLECLSPQHGASDPPLRSVCVRLQKLTSSGLTPLHIAVAHRRDAHFIRRVARPIPPSHLAGKFRAGKFPEFHEFKTCADFVPFKSPAGTRTLFSENFPAPNFSARGLSLPTELSELPC